MKSEAIQTEAPKAYILIGLPGSGKSTWMREIMKTGKFVVISTDDEIEKFAKESGLTYSQVFDAYIKTATSNMRGNLKTAISQGSSIIWDQTNMSAKKRKGIIQSLPKSYDKIAVVFQVDRGELENRLAKRAKEEGKFIPKHVIDNMEASFQMPTLDEGFKEIIRV